MRAAFGRVVRPHYHFDRAKVIICLDADPLHFDPAAIRNSRQLAQGRDADHGVMSRLYCVESHYNDHGCQCGSPHVDPQWQNRQFSEITGRASVGKESGR